MNIENGSARSVLGLSTLAVSALCFAAGCGGQGPQEDGSTGAVEQAWSDSCAGYTTPDASRTGKIDPSITTPSGYTKCTKSYLIDVSNYDSAYTGTGSGGGPDARITANYGGSAISNATDCQNSDVGIILFKKVGSSWVDISGQVASYGIWTSMFGCIFQPAIATGMVAGDSYRAAVTARDPSNNAVPVVVTSEKAVHL
ncbi:MAG: hypothetical protein ABW061_08980 [Polyangiaceae bacterium]